MSNDHDNGEDPATFLDHENLDVYQLSLDFAERASKIVKSLPKPMAHMADQLSRASSSIVLNTAEGSGRWSPGDQARFYRIARGSAKECGAALDFLYRTESLSFQDAANGKMVLTRIVAMLTGLSKSLETSPGGRKPCGFCGK